MTTRDTGDLAGQVIASQFRVERLLGQGGMGAVYLAEQIEMGRKVVVKVMNPAQIGSPDLEARFKREARAVAQLNHPNVVQVHVFGRTDDGQLYLAMEFIEGHTLAELLRQKGPLPEARALRILDQMASALVEAHDLGLVHRDLKPDNVMLTDRHGTSDYVKVLDFGIAKMLDAPDAKLTQTGAIFGTPQYMAPEQAKGKHIDQRTDIYALGLILHEMLTGQGPFVAESTMEYLVKHMSEPVLPPSRKFAGLVMLPRTEAIIMRCLQKEPAERFQSVAELQRELRQCLRDRPDAGKSFPTPDGPTTPRHDAQAIAPTVAGAATLAAKVTDTPTVRHAVSRALLGLGLVAVAGAAATASWLALRREHEEAPGVTAPSNDQQAAAGLPRPAEDPRASPPLDASATAIASDVAPVNNRKPAKAPRHAQPATTGLARAQGGDEPTSADEPDAPAAADVPAAGPPFEDIPAPRGARLMSSTPQALTLTLDLPPAQVLAFYKQHGKRLWGTYKTFPGGLQFTGETAPVTYVSLSRTAGAVMVSFARNVMVERPKPTGGRTVFGVSVPPGAEATVETPTAAVFQIAKPIDGIVAFYRKRLIGKPGTTFVETQIDGSPYLVVTAEDKALPFANVAVMKTPASLQPGPGDWTQITISK